MSLLEWKLPAYDLFLNLVDFDVDPNEVELPFGFVALHEHVVHVQRCLLLLGAAFDRRGLETAFIRWEVPMMIAFRFY